VNHYQPTTEVLKMTKNQSSMPWFHGKISREEAERLLRPSDSKDGLFLVRESTNFPGDYTLCVVFQQKVEHYRIIARQNQLTIDEEESFDTLGRLVEHYTEDADGLCTKLIQNLPKIEQQQQQVVPNQHQEQQNSLDVEAFREAGWVINEADVKIKERIGKGEFGDVMLGFYQGQKVAIKVMKDMQPQRTKQFLAEATVMT
jgi:c-src tyrosine kinase